MSNVFITKKLWPFLVSLGGATVMILAFFIPSIQEQWDRYQSRGVIGQYEEIGNDFFQEEKFKMAEDAYAKAFELSGEKRLDIEVKRLTAKVNRISQDPAWGSKLPEGLEEVDFEFLLHLQKGKQNAPARLSTLNSYGIFLSSMGRLKEAEETFTEAIHLDSTDVLGYINIGNLLDQRGELKEAEKVYRKAILLNPDNGLVHYNLGLLFSQQGRLKEAASEFQRAIEYDSTDVDAKNEYDSTLKQLARRPPSL